MEVTKDKLLGFGCMRLPLLDQDDPTSFDYPLIERLFDAFLERGFDYFDTAYVYHGYHGEEAVRKALVERHPRGSFKLATKLPLRDFKDRADMERIFREQLANSGVSYFDYYLLHNVGSNVYAKCVSHDAFGFIRELRDAGRIRYSGMSFHDTPEMLDEILGRYGQCFDFVQLQINYVDWDQPNVQARRCLEVANKYQKPIVVMEPCKGGTLIRLPAPALTQLAKAVPAAAPAQLALRFAATRPGVFNVLSGMNSLAQVLENAAVLGEYRPLDPQEQALIAHVTALINQDTAVACTGCGYCVPGCPRKIAIPEYFATYNSYRRNTINFSSQITYYNNTALKGRGKAKDCIGCGQCERACPQHLRIRDYLKDVSAAFDFTNPFPVRR